MVIHIKWNNDKEGIILPINPSSLRFKNSMNNTSVTVHDFGEVNLKGKRNLREITLESFFPSQKLHFAKDTEFHKPYSYYVKKLATLMRDNTTVHLIVTDTRINAYFTIESFEYGHDDKTMDVHYTMTLKEYREIGSTKPKTKSRVTKEKKTKTVTWKKGDTWHKVTKSVLGSSETWKTQKKNNKSVITKAKKKYPKKKEIEALVGYKVVIKS